MYTNLVLSGGGVKGIAIISAISELEKMGILKNITNYAGASVGSLIACLIAIGYTANEIKGIINTIDYDKILDDKAGYIRDVYNLITDYGYASGDYLYNMIGKLIKDKTGNIDYTLEDLYNKQHKKLIITTTNLNTRSVVYLQAGHTNTHYSNITLRKAIRMSMSIPFVFEPVLYHDCLHVDGGCLDNYPLNCFDPYGKTLGLRLVQDRPEKQEINNLYDYSYAYIETFLAENDRKHKDTDRTIVIKTAQYGLSKFVLTEEEKQTLMKQGKEAVKNYFKV